MNEALEKLSNVIDRICGELRSIEDLADDSGVGIATIYRLKRADFKRRPSENILRSLAGASDGRVTYDELSEAVSNVLEHQPGDPLARSHRARRDAQRAEAFFFGRLKTSCKKAFLTTDVVPLSAASGSMWDGIIDIPNGDAGERWLFEVKFFSESRHIQWDLLNGLVGLFALREGPDLSGKWLHIVVASPSTDINEVCRKHFSKIESAVPVSILPMCTASKQVFPEILLYKGRAKKRIEI